MNQQLYVKNDDGTFVPAAGVHDLEMQQYIGARLRRVATAAGVTVDYGDDEFYYAGAFSILGDIARVLENHAAGVQGDADMLRDMLAIQDACGLHTDEYAPGSVIEYIKELEAENNPPAKKPISKEWCERMAKVEIEADCNIEAGSPDSGRDAAHYKTCEGYIAERDRYRRDRDEWAARAEKAEAALAAHPAPSSDAKPLAYLVYGIGAGKHYVKTAKLIKDDDWKTDDDGLGEYWAGNELLILAAHPANGAQAGLSEALGDVIKGEIRSSYNDGYGHGKADGDKTSSRFVPGNVVAECWTAILAATKKGG